MKRVAARTRSFTGGSITPGSTVPGAPTIGTATAGNTTATVTFTPPGNNGGAMITGYRATSTPGGITATGASSPITVTGLTNGTAYTFTVAAQNINGFGPESAASNSVTPVAVTVSLSNLTVLTGGDTGGVILRRNGTLARTISLVPQANVAGQWVSAGASATVGDAYEVSFNGGAYQRIDADRIFEASAPGSFTVEIRPNGGGAVLASSIISVSN